MKADRFPARGKRSALPFCCQTSKERERQIFLREHSGRQEDKVRPCRPWARDGGEKNRDEKERVSIDGSGVAPARCARLG